MIVTANVRHSQSVTAPPLKSWVAAEKCGAIICSHCTCMAGLGGVCSHIAALLFAAEAHNRLKDTSCTSQPCAWLSPNMQNVAYTPISDINFTQTERGSKMVNLVKISIGICVTLVKYNGPGLFTCIFHSTSLSVGLSSSATCCEDVGVTLWYYQMPLCP